MFAGQARITATQELMPYDCNPEYFDAHCHWQGPVAGLTGHEGSPEFPVSAAEPIPCCCCATGPDDWETLRQAATWHAGMVVAYGIHPWVLQENLPPDDMLALLCRMLEADPSAAVGEAGLDAAHRGVASLVLQRSVLLEQLRLAQQLNRVVVIHCVRTWGLLLDVLDEAGPLPRGWVLHAYSGSPEMVAPLRRRGAFFSFKSGADGALQAKQTERIQAVPRDRLLLESDMTICAGDAKTAEVLRGRLKRTATGLAAATGMTLEEVAALTAINARAVFVAPGGGQNPISAG